jgi:hypothetical protein
MAPDVADRKNAWRFEHMVGGKYSFSNQNPNPAAMTLPENMLLAWAHAHPDVAPAFLAAIVPALTNRNPDAGEQTWHPMMKFCWMNLATAKMFCARSPETCARSDRRDREPHISRCTVDHCENCNLIQLALCAVGRRRWGLTLSERSRQPAMKTLSCMPIGICSSKMDGF